MYPFINISFLNINVSGATWKRLLLKVFPSYLSCPHVKYFVKQIPQVALCIVIKIYIRQKNDIYQHHFTNRSLLRFIMWSLCILQYGNLAFQKMRRIWGKGILPDIQGGCWLEVLIKYIWINISESYRDSKWCFSLLRI